MYTSRADKALTSSGFVAGGIMRVGGGLYNNAPIIADGVDTIDISQISNDFFGANHSGYVECPLVLSDIGALMKDSVRPPHRRSPLLKQRFTSNGTYWEFPRTL